MFLKASTSPAVQGQHGDLVLPTSCPCGAVRSECFRRYPMSRLKIHTSSLAARQPVTRMHLGQYPRTSSCQCRHQQCPKLPLHTERILHDLLQICLPSECSGTMAAAMSEIIWPPLELLIAEIHASCLSARWPAAHRERNELPSQNRHFSRFLCTIRTRRSRPRSP